MAENVEKLQEYAVEHCGGDRYRAIHELMLSSGEAGFDPYVDELTQDEAGFVVTLLTLDAIRFYGGKKNFISMVKAGSIAAQLGTTTDEVLATPGNPYKKDLLFGILLMLGAIMLSVLPAMLPQSAFTEIITLCGSVMIGLAAINLSAKIIPFLKYNKIKKLLKKIPQLPAEAIQAVPPPTFEQAMELHRATGGKI